MHVTHQINLPEGGEWISVVKRNQVIYEAKSYFPCYVSTDNFTVILSAVP